MTTLLITLSYYNVIIIRKILGGCFFFPSSVALNGGRKDVLPSRPKLPPPTVNRRGFSPTLRYDSQGSTGRAHCSKYYTTITPTAVYVTASVTTRAQTRVLAIRVNSRHTRRTCRRRIIQGGLFLVFPFLRFLALKRRFSETTRFLRYIYKKKYAYIGDIHQRFTVKTYQFQRFGKSAEPIYRVYSYGEIVIDNFGFFSPAEYWTGGNIVNAYSSYPFYCVLKKGKNIYF